MPHRGLDTMRCVKYILEVAPGARVLRLLLPGMLVAVFIDCCCVAGRMEVMQRVISAT
jgi:hypothetical protein